MISLKKDVILYIHYIKEMQLVLNNFKLYGEVVEIDQKQLEKLCTFFFKPSVNNLNFKI